LRGRNTRSSVHPGAPVPLHRAMVPTLTAGSGGEGIEMAWWQVVLLVLFLGVVAYYTVKVIRPRK